MDGRRGCTPEDYEGVFAELEESTPEKRAGFPGNLVRNVFSGPGIDSIDLSLFKMFALTERIIRSMDSRIRI